MVPLQSSRKVTKTICITIVQANLGYTAGKGGDRIETASQDDVHDGCDQGWFNREGPAGRQIQTEAEKGLNCRVAVGIKRRL